LAPKKKRRRLSTNLRHKSPFKDIGPGVITGASDDDPSGIGTYSQAGALFGFGMLWMTLFLFPLMYTIQEICGRIGLVTGSGLGKVIKDKYSNKVMLPLASLLLIANTINICVDLGAMASSIRILFPQISPLIATMGFTIFILFSEIYLPYNKFARVLKFTALSLFAYVITAILVGGNAFDITLSTLLPHIEFTKEYAMMFVAIFGTTISPYLFFWQTSEEVEEEVMTGKTKEMGKKRSKQAGKTEFRKMKADTAIGMAFSQVIMWAIIVTCSGTLHSQGITNIQTADQAAQALEPLTGIYDYSGLIAKSVFALGIIGTGLLAIPILAGGCGYVLADTFGWKQGLYKKFNEAKAFYAVISLATIIGLFITLVGIDPIQALIYSAVINGVLALPMLVAIMKISNDRSILKEKINNRKTNYVGWSTIIINGISVVYMIITIL
jgi:Mn2+/Fe2+ NRAMP family transporter